jgi:hypothetical protein
MLSPPRKGKDPGLFDPPIVTEDGEKFLPPLSSLA